MAFTCKCPKCQADVTVIDTTVAQTIICPNCGSEVIVLKPVEQRKCTMATVSLVFGLLSFIMVPFCGLVSLMTGIVSLCRIRDSHGVLLGNGKAIAGIVLGFWSIVRFFMLAIFAAILLPALLAAREKAREHACMSNMKQIYMALVTFPNDNNGNVPENYEQLLKYMDMGNKPLRCPCAKDNEANYALLPDAKGKKLSDIGVASETPVVMCTRHKRNTLLLYADGHIACFPKKQTTR